MKKGIKQQDISGRHVARAVPRDGPFVLAKSPMIGGTRSAGNRGVIGVKLANADDRGARSSCVGYADPASSAD